MTDQEAEIISNLMIPYGSIGSMVDPRMVGSSTKAVILLMRMRDQGLIAITDDKLVPTQAGIRAYFDRFPEKEPKP
jgi:hypothetical protein